MAKLDLEWLSVFDQVYECSSVSRAADRLGIAQATASIALSKLRTHFGDKLFSRTSHGMQPTPYARDIHPALKDVLTRLEQARSSRLDFVPAASQRTFRICMTDISEVVLLPALVNQLQRIAPRVRVEAETISVNSPARLEEGDVDLAVGFMPHLEAGFYQRTLMTESFVCLAAADHPRVATRVTKAGFEEEGHIVVSTSGTGHAIVDKVFAQRKVNRNVVLRLPSFLGVARIVAQTELLVIVPRRVGVAFAAQERVKMLAPPVQLPPYQVKLHWHERFHADAGNAWLRQLIAELTPADPH